MLWLTKGLGPGGTERLLVDLGRTRDPERLQPVAAYVLPWKDHLAGDLEAAGVETVCLSTRRRDPRWPLRLRRLIADGGFAVVHSHSPLPAVVARLAARTVPRHRRPALVTTEHNAWTSYRPPTRWANRLTSGVDSATFAVTDEVRAGLRGAAARRAEVIVHGIDVDRAACDSPSRPGDERQAVRAGLGLGRDEVVAVTVANLTAQKDYPTLLAAARLLVERDVAFRLIAVGQGPLEAEVTARRDELGLGDHVVLAGFRPDAVAVMAACDVFVLASAWEGLPVAVMEATALGLPIVATNVGGVAEQFTATGAVLVPRRDPAALAAALEPVLTDAGRRAELSAAARARASRFDTRRSLLRLTACYEQLAREPGDEPGDVVRPPARSTARRSRAVAEELRPAAPEDREQILALLQAALGWEDDHRARELYAWKHERNPFGPSLAWVAEHDECVVAVRLFMRWEFRRGGSTVRAVRAVDTATLPAYQGRGLFTALTERALEGCREEGVAFVFNTPNAASLPGYLKLGWREVGRPAAAVRVRRPGDLAAVARSRVPAERWSLAMDTGPDLASWLDGGGTWPEPRTVSSTDRTLRTATDERFARWRYGLTGLDYRVVEDRDAAIVVRLRRRGPGRELVVAERLGDPDRADALAVGTLRRVGATHALRLGAPNLRRGFLPLPAGGPRLTWRGVCDLGPPPLSNWDFALGDLELF